MRPRDARAARREWPTGARDAGRFGGRPQSCMAGSVRRCSNDTYILQHVRSICSSRSCKQFARYLTGMCGLNPEPRSYILPGAYAGGYRREGLRGKQLRLRARSWSSRYSHATGDMVQRWLHSLETSARTDPVPRLAIADHTQKPSDLDRFV